MSRFFILNFCKDNPPLCQSQAQFCLEMGIAHTAVGIVNDVNRLVEAYL